MPTGSTLVAFAGATTLLVLLPGPAMLFLVARGISGGRRAGVVSAVGVEAATATYVLATALGLSALLASSAVALSVVRYVGAAYLVWLGIGVLRGRGEAESEHEAPRSPAPRGTWTLLRQGYLVGIGNPKAALFFLAFFPQFVDTGRGSVVTQILVLGAVFVLIGLAFDACYGALAGSLHGFLSRRTATARRGRIAIGMTYVGLGGYTALTGHRAA